MPNSASNLSSLERIVLLIVLLVSTDSLVLSHTTGFPPTPRADIHSVQLLGKSAARRLELGKSVEQELKGGESHWYEIALMVGQYVHIVVDQRGIDVVVILYEPSGKKVVEIDSPNGTQGPEPVSLVAETSGAYQMEVRSGEKDAVAGRYVAKIEALRTATTQDNSEMACSRALIEAEQLYAQGTEESLRRAFVKYNEALSLTRATGDRSREALTLENVGDVHNLLGENTAALDYLNQALLLWRALGNRVGEGRTVNHIGLVYDELGQKSKALEYYNQALPLRRAEGDRRGEAYTLHNIGGIYNDLGENEKALSYFNQALPLWGAVGDRAGEALTISNIGAIHLSFGEEQKALDDFNKALTLSRSASDRRRECDTLNGIGLVYDSLGDKEKALDYYNQALSLARVTGYRRKEALSLNNIGGAIDDMGDKQKARDFYNQALPLWRAVGDRAGEALTLHNLGKASHDLGENQKALDYLNQGLSLFRALNDAPGQVIILAYLGWVYEHLGEQDKARDFFNQAHAINREVGDRSREANILYGVACVERDRGNLDEARSHIEAALKIIDSLRANVFSQQLRASYFASVHDYYELRIDILMRLHKQHPSEDLDSAALETTERARARSLLELLAEAHADIRQGVDPALLENERSLQRLISAKTERQMRLFGTEHTDEERITVATEIENLKIEYQGTEAQIKATSQHYAALTQPQPLGSKEIQKILDKDTVILEYSLGRNRSYLWAVTSSSITSYGLPRRAEIELAAKRFYTLLANSRTQLRDQKQERGVRMASSKAEQGLFIDSVAMLSQMLLGPADSQLTKKRFVIVADGALEYMPFGALTFPKPKPKGGNNDRTGKSYRPLLLEHEIVNLPSSSTLASIRGETDGRKPPDKIVAVLADPVFDPSDDRVAKARTQQRSESSSAKATFDRALFVNVEKAAVDTGLVTEDFRIPRLPGTRQEADRIAAFASPITRMKALDFDASRATALSPSLGRYRYVHFATHGFLNAINPELSGIVLSMVDEQGRPQNGFLLAHEVFNLRLPVDLVVLSGCQTGLGKDVRGEGLDGLTRGLMYAGAQRVIVSLWSVNDDATADLMGRLYEGLLKKHMRPAAALRRAQIGIWKQKEWRAPYYWAAFVLQGEWR